MLDWKVTFRFIAVSLGVLWSCFTQTLTVHSVLRVSCNSPVSFHKFVPRNLSGTMVLTFWYVIVRMRRKNFWWHVVVILRSARKINSRKLSLRWRTSRGKLNHAEKNWRKNARFHFCNKHVRDNLMCTVTSCPYFLPYTLESFNDNFLRWLENIYRLRERHPTDAVFRSN